MHLHLRHQLILTLKFSAKQRTSNTSKPITSPLCDRTARTDIACAQGAHRVGGNRCQES